MGKNGYGDAIGFGGDAGGGDYEIRLDNGTRYLSIYSPNAADYTTVLKVDRNAKIDQRLGLMGYDPNELPSGWGGGLRTLDVYAAGTVGTGSGGTVNAYMNSSGNIYASGNIEAAKNVKGATLESTGRATVGEFVQVNGTVSEGDSCSTNGLMGRTGNGTPMYCIDGYWTNIVSSKTKNGGMFLPGGMKMMWGTLSENLTDYGSLDGLSYFESKFKTYEPTFIANGKTYKFSNIFSVQFSPVDVGGAAMERMWGTPYSGSFSYAFSSAIKTTMTGTYLAIGY